MTAFIGAFTVIRIYPDIFCKSKSGLCFLGERYMTRLFLLQYVYSQTSEDFLDCPEFRIASA